MLSALSFFVEVGFVQDLAFMKAGERDLAGADQDGVVLGDIGLVAPGREVAGADHARLADENGNHEGLVAAARERVLREAQHGPVELSSRPADHVGARPGELHAALEVEDAEGPAERDVILLARRERRGGAGGIGPGADEPVVAGIGADGPRGIGDGGKLEHDLLGLGLGGGLRVGQGLLLLLQLVAAGHEPFELGVDAAAELPLEGADPVGELPLLSA